MSTPEGKLYCPLMCGTIVIPENSYRNMDESGPQFSWVRCMEDDCGWYDKRRNCCSIIPVASE